MYRAWLQQFFIYYVNVASDLTILYKQDIKLKDRSLYHPGVKLLGAKLVLILSIKYYDECLLYSIKMLVKIIVLVIIRQWCMMIQYIAKVAHPIILNLE